MGPAQDRDFILRQGEKCSTLYKFYTEKENQMKTVLRAMLIQGAVVCPLMKPIEGDPARLGAHVRDPGDTPSHAGSQGSCPKGG